MSTVVMIDKTGRVVIPKTLRDELRLAFGNTLTLESEGDSMRLRPVRSASALRKEQGIWVFRNGTTLRADDTDKALDALRLQRDSQLRRSE